MSTLREEELPRRIAFVSDKVFEPRWYAKLFLRPSFAAAAVIAAAILVHAFVRPASAPANASRAGGYQRAIEARVTAEVTARLQSEMATAVNTAVTKAVAETEKRDDQRTAMLLSASGQALLRRRRFSQQTSNSYLCPEYRGGSSLNEDLEESPDCAFPPRGFLRLPPQRLQVTRRACHGPRWLPTEKSLDNRFARLWSDNPFVRAGSHARRLFRRLRRGVHGGSESGGGAADQHHDAAA